LVDYGYLTIVVDARNSSERAVEHLKYLASTSVDGLIFLASSYTIDPEILEHIRRKSGLVSISAMKDQTNLGLQSFVVNNQSGTRQAALHLSDLGYQNIGVIVGSNIYQPDNTERLQGVLDGCKEMNMAVDPKHIVCEDEGGWNPSVGYRSMMKLLSQDPLPDAVCAFDDVTAFGAIRAIYDQGMRVPEDIAVVGFDDVMVSNFYNPPLTTIKQPIQNLTEAASKYLVQAIEDETCQSAECIAFEPELVIRKSTNRSKNSIAA